jgi:hypothetical protein
VSLGYYDIDGGSRVVGVEGWYEGRFRYEALGDLLYGLIWSY